MARKKKKELLKPLAPGEDGLVEVEVVEERLGRKAGEHYKVDPLRAAKLLQSDLCRLPEVIHG